MKNMTKTLILTKHHKEAEWLYDELTGWWKCCGGDKSKTALTFGSRLQAEREIKAYHIKHHMKNKLILRQMSLRKRNSYTTNFLAGGNVAVETTLRLG